MLGVRANLSGSLEVDQWGRTTWPDVWCRGRLEVWTDDVAVERDAKRREPPSAAEISTVGLRNNTLRTSAQCSLKPRPRGTARRRCSDHVYLCRRNAVIKQVSEEGASRGPPLDVPLCIDHMRCGNPLEYGDPIECGDRFNGLPWAQHLRKTPRLYCLCKHGFATSVRVCTQVLADYLWSACRGGNRSSRKLRNIFLVGRMRVRRVRILRRWLRLLLLAHVHLHGRLAALQRLQLLRGKFSRCGGTAGVAGATDSTSRCCFGVRLRCARGSAWPASRAGNPGGVAASALSRDGDEGQMPKSIQKLCTSPGADNASYHKWRLPIPHPCMQCRGRSHERHACMHASAMRRQRM